MQVKRSTHQGIVRSKRASTNRFYSWQATIALTSIVFAMSGCSKSQPDDLLADKSKFAVADAEAPATAAENSISGSSANLAQQNTPAQTTPTRESSATAAPNPVAADIVDADSLVSASSPTGPNAGQAAPGTVSQPPEVARTFTSLAPHTSDEPVALLEYFGKADEAIRDLTIAAQNRQIEKERFMELAKHICTMKYNAAISLHSSSKSNPDQQKAGMLCQLEALSNLTGLQDVEAAKKLQALASQLEKEADADLAHQSKLVMLGFRLNALQEGQEKDPTAILKAVDELFVRPEDKGYPELMAVQNCAQRLMSMNYKEAAAALSKKLADVYRDSPDQELSMMAWTIEVNTSPTFQTFVRSLQMLLSGQSTDGKEVVASSNELIEKFPSINTLVQLANHLVNIEYSGNADTSKQIAALIKEKLQAYNASPLAEQIAKHIQTQHQRLDMLGKPLDMSGFSTFTGQAFDWAPYRGKVVLVDFWASWCVPCLNEMPNIQNAYDTLNKQGFEVVGVNLDDKNLPDVENFIRSKNFPWQTVRSSNPSELGFETPIVKKFGISAIPFVILVDREGNVAAMHVRGEKIVKAAQALLGPATAQQ